MLLGAYKDRARQWHWYDGETWDFENWKYGHKPATDDPFPTSQDIVGYGRSNGWSENQGFFQYICQSSTGYLDYCQTSVLGLGLGVDFTFTWNNNNDKNPQLNFLTGTALGTKEQGVGIRDVG